MIEAIKIMKEPVMKVEVVKKPCAFVLHVKETTETLVRLTCFLQDNFIMLDKLQMHRFRNGEAMVIIHCHIETDAIDNTIRSLEGMDGVIKFERMGSGE